MKKMTWMIIAGCLMVSGSVFASDLGPQKTIDCSKIKASLAEASKVAKQKVDQAQPAASEDANVDSAQ